MGREQRATRDREPASNIECSQTCFAFQKCDPSIRRDAPRHINDRYFTGLLANLNELSTVEGLTLTDSRVKDVIDDLVLSQGIGFPMASAILKFIKPTLFPILDVRAYRALTGVRPSYSTYSYDKYISYAEKLTDLARKLNRPLREIDEQLYCYDKQHNGKI